MPALKTKPEPVQMYRGAETCDLVPDWCDTDPDLLAMLRACHAADPDELTPQLALADMLAERDDPREAWVRLGCELWVASSTLKPGRADWDYEQARAALQPVCKTAAGWRLACLWGHLVAWHSPSDVGRKPMGRTWVDARVLIVNRCVWWWSMGLLKGQAGAAWSQAGAAWSQAYAAGSQAYAAGSQADAAGSQADAAWRQAYAAWSQADAAGSQADAAGRQAYAAWSQADAAGSQAYAAGSQAYAAWSQADAAGRQADAAWRQAYAAGSQADAAGRQKRVWRFARALLSLCEAKIPLAGA